MSLLFSPTKLGSLTLQNRLVMSPLTRNRATGNVPNDLMVEYYKQRASAGLIITEGTSPSPNGLGYPRIPGAFSAAQVAGWKRVTDAVHARGAKIFLQLMHTGRIGHPNNLPAGATRRGAIGGRRRGRDLYRRGRHEAARDAEGDDRGGYQDRDW